MKNALKAIVFGIALVASLPTSAVAATISGNVLVSPYFGPGSVGTVDLTSQGSTDWIQWDGTEPTDFDRKNVTQRISTWSEIGGDLINGTFNDGYTFNWTDGTPMAAGSTTTATNAGPTLPGHGYQFTVTSVNTNVHRLTVYTAVFNALDQLTATIGTESYVGSNGGPTGGNGVFEAVYTIKFVPDFAGQLLTVEWIDTGAGNALALHGATLSVIPEPGTFGLALLGLCALVGCRGRRPAKR